MKKTLAHEFEEAVAKIQALEVELAQNTAANSQAVADLKARDEQIAALTKNHADLAQELANAVEASKKSEATIAELTTKISELEASAKSAEQIAGERLANVATEPVGALASAPVTKDELWAQYHALTDQMARRDFWTKHKSQLS